MMFDTVDCRTPTEHDVKCNPRGERPVCVLDVVHLRTYTLGMADLEREILGLFLEQLPKSQAALKGSQSAKDWHMAAHTLKGSALAVGAKRLAAIGAKAEAADCGNEDARTGVLAQVAAAVAEIGDEIARLGLI
jgi:HPt (histidine-containing phosphotransfer) domain-containing protein